METRRPISPYSKPTSHFKISLIFSSFFSLFNQVTFNFVINYIFFKWNLSLICFNIFKLFLPGHYIKYFLFIGRIHVSKKMFSLTFNDINQFQMILSCLFCSYKVWSDFVLLPTLYCLRTNMLAGKRSLIEANRESCRKKSKCLYPRAGVLICR